MLRAQMNIISMQIFWLRRQTFGEGKPESEAWMEKAGFAFSSRASLQLRT